jgi:ribonuclease Z
MKYKIRHNRIERIFISHLHGDHYLGLIGLLFTMQLHGRKTALSIYGPRELADIITLQLKVANTAFKFPLEFIAVDTTLCKVLYEDEHLQIESIPLNHRIACCGFLFREKPGKRRIIKELLPEGLPFGAMAALKAGKNIDHQGRILHNEHYTLPPRRSRSYAYCSDTCYHEALIPQISKVDLLYHEATFTEEFAARAAETYHSTARQAALIAASADVGRLLLGHFSVRYADLSVFLNEARPIFPKTSLAQEGFTEILPD